MKNFYKEHKTACIITASAAALLIIVAIILSICISKDEPANSDTPSDAGSSSQSADLNIENPEDENSNVSQTLPDSDNYISPDETVANDILSDNKSNTSSNSGSTGTNSKPGTNTGTTANTTSSNNSSSSQNSGSNNGTTSTPTIVQAADPKTGISWDGKSKIVYTYSDGSTGTVPKLGATYELFPDWYVTVEGCVVCGKIECPGWYGNDCPEAVPWDGTCSYCGKVSGDGTNGTCVRWLMSDQICPNCKANVPAHTCHTCN